MATVTHTTAATGVDSADGKISKNAWNEGHSVVGGYPMPTDPDDDIEQITPVGIWPPRAAGYTTSAQNATTQTVAVSSTLVSLAVTLEAGAYLVVGDLYVNTAGVGKIALTSTNQGEFGYTRDARNVGMFTLFGIYTSTGASDTLALFWTRESGTATFGLGGDIRWARNIRVVRII